MRLFQAVIAGLGTFALIVLLWHALLCWLFELQDYFARKSVDPDR